MIMSGLSERFALCVILFVCLQIATGAMFKTTKENSNFDQTLDAVEEPAVNGFDDTVDVDTLLKIYRYVSEAGRIVPIIKSVEGDDHLCADSLELTLEHLWTGSMWATQMVDASSKVPSGLLQGNLVDLGSFDECLSVAVPGLLPDEAPLFTGQHCMIDLTVHFQQSPSFLSPGVLKTLGNSVPYTFSLCLPSTCAPTTIRTTVVKVADKINALLHGNVTVTMDVKDSGCHTDDRPSLGTMEIVGIVVTVGILVLAAISTIIDLTLTYRDNNEGVSREVPEGLGPLLAFSLYSNGRRLLKTDPSAGTIRTLHGLKFLSIAWVLLGHRVKFSANGAPLVNLLTLANVVKQWSSMVLLNATLSVDVFFVISGILNTYVYMSAKKVSPLSHFRHYVHRYLRLTPAYAVMMLVTGTWLYRTGSGPLWDRLVGDARNSCSDYWWTGLLYINNYYNPNDSCMMQSWYLAVDMQLFWLSPLVLYPLKRWPLVGISLLITLIIPSIVIPFLVAYINLIKTPIPISFDTEKVDSEMAKLYVPTHTKTISYVIGMIAGYILHLVKDDKTRFKQSPVQCAALWVSAGVAMGWALFGAHPLFQLDQPYDRWHSSLYIAFYRFAWSAGVAWIIVATATGHGGVVGWMLSWRAFAPLGRLTYCIYLTHVAVILYGIGTLRQPQYFSYYDMFMKFLGELVISSFLAVLLSLTIEAPIMRLEKILFKKGREERRVSFRESRPPYSRGP